MTYTQKKDFLSYIFPHRRFDLDFPLINWFVGLWLYLKSFLYLCYFYSLGLEPYADIDRTMWVEIIYFGAMCLPIFYLAYCLWNEKNRARAVAFVFLLIDTPLLFVHVMRLASSGYMESGLTEILEYGGLGLNLLALGWLFSYSMSAKAPSERK